MRDVRLFLAWRAGVLAGLQTRAMRLQRRQAIQRARSLRAWIRREADGSGSE